MAWKVELEASAQKDIRKLDQSVAKRILIFLHERLAPLDNPRTLGEALQGSRFEGLWKYRVGDDRIICKLEDARLIVLVVEIGHRRSLSLTIFGHLGNFQAQDETPDGITNNGPVVHWH